MYIRLIAGFAALAALSLALPSQAYDPMRVMRNGQILSGQAYSTFDPLTTHGAYASPEATVPIEAREIGVSVLNFNAYVQFKDVKDIADDIDVLVDEANDIQNNYSKALALRSDVDRIVSELQSKGNVVNGMVSSSGILPLVTWTDPRVKGSLSFDYQGNASVGIDLPYAFAANVDGASVGLNDSCGTDNNNDGIPDSPVGFDQTKCAIDTSATFNFIGVTDFSSYSLGYSRQVYSRANENPYKSGKLVVGGRANYFSLTTGVYVLRIDEDSNNADLEDVIRDLKSNKKTNGGFDFDLGVNWVSDRYVAGATLGNLLTPDIEYANGDKVEPGMPIAIHGAWLLHPESKRWGVRLHNDLTGQKDPVGTELQWRTLSIGYASESWWIPGFEIGKRWNLGKDGLSYTDFGLKLFQLVRFQAAIADKSVSGIPQSFIFSSSVGLKF